MQFTWSHRTAQSRFVSPGSKQMNKICNGVASIFLTLKECTKLW